MLTWPGAGTRRDPSTAMPRLLDYLTMGYPIRILIADDGMRSRQGLSALLSTLPNVRIVGQAIDGQQALRDVEAHCPDVVIIDARMPQMDGITATRLIKQRWPKIRVVVLSMYARYRDEALSAGADAFLTKGGAPDKLLGAIVGST